VSRIYYNSAHLGGCPRIVFAVRSSENFVDKAERAKSLQLRFKDMGFSASLGYLVQYSARNKEA